MTEIEAALRAILCGGGIETANLLHNCRFEGAGARLYGRDAILECFQRSPVRLKAAALVTTERFAALFGTSDGGPVAVFADLYGAHIARVWYLAHQTMESSGEGRLDVPLDVDLSERTEELAFDPQDHPDLAPVHHPYIIDVSQRFLPLRLGRPSPLVEHRRVRRLRPIVLRAFSQADAMAVLLSVHSLRTDGIAGTVRFNAAAWLTVDACTDATVVVDEATCAAELTRTWNPIL